MSLNRLPPAIREDYRYLKFRIHAEDKIDLGSLVDTVWNSCLNYLGTKESSKANFWVVGNKFDEESQEGIIKVKKEKVDEFRAALCLIDSFKESKGFVEVTKTSGSIEGLQ